MRGTVGELRASGVDVPGADLAFSGDVPAGSGLSSSAALEAALALALLALAGADEPDRVELARLCSRVENDWVGAETGLLDQLASLCCERGRRAADRLRDARARDACRSTCGGWQLVDARLGRQHEHAAGGYNARRAECREICARLGIEHVSRADPDEADALPGRARPPRAPRARRRTPAWTRWSPRCGAGDLRAAGRLLDASHASLRDDYEASVPEVEDAVRACKDAGAAGARMVGGGFGGSVLGLFPPGSPGSPPVRSPSPPARRPGSI